MKQNTDLPDVQTRGEIVIIGQIKVPKMPYGIDFPIFHFVVIERPSGEENDWKNGRYVATCLHLQIDGYGASTQEACADMVRRVNFYLYENFNDPDPEYRASAWENIIDAVKSNPRMDVLWDKYRLAQLEFAKRGISTDRSVYLYEKIYALLDENRN